MKYIDKFDAMANYIIDAVKSGKEITPDKETMQNMFGFTDAEMNRAIDDFSECLAIAKSRKGAC